MNIEFRVEMLLLVIRRNQKEMLKEIGNKGWETREGVAEIKAWVIGVEMRAGALNVTSSPSQYFPCFCAQRALDSS